MNPHPYQLIAPCCSFTQDEAHRAHDEWGCNCGPGALAAMLKLKPDDVRSHIPGFDKKRYTNPTMMRAALGSLSMRFREAAATEVCCVTNELRAPVFPINSSCKSETFPKYGLARVQWEGPWLEKGVPIAARYRQTHWVGSLDDGAMLHIFDINSGWVSYAYWRDFTVPNLVKHVVKRATGGWYLTHRWQLFFPSRPQGVK